MSSADKGKRGELSVLSEDSKVHGISCACSEHTSFARDIAYGAKASLFAAPGRKIEKESLFSVKLTITKSLIQERIYMQTGRILHSQK